MVLAFSVSIPRSVQSAASQNGVVVHSSDIIYRVMDHIRNCVISMLPCTYETKVVGEATVIQLFDIHTKGKNIKKIAGCRVGNGVVEKTCTARVIREGQVIHEGMQQRSWYASLLTLILQVLFRHCDISKKK